LPENDVNRKEKTLRREIIDTCLRMNREGINQGTSGNVSARWNDGMLITPSGVPYEDLRARNIVFVDGNGTPASSQRPSSEWRFHLAILQARPEVGAVVHTHSVHATALSIRGMEIPAVHYMVAAAGGPTIRCAPYATFGTRELSDRALQALTDRRACLLANHGVIATGPDLSRALWLAGEVETLARQYILSLSLGEPKILPDDEIARVARRLEMLHRAPEATTRDETGFDPPTGGKDTARHV
jgi:L-fuculose-phosphate aldolase